MALKWTPLKSVVQAIDEKDLHTRFDGGCWLMLETSQLRHPNNPSNIAVHIIHCEPEQSGGRFMATDMMMIDHPESAPLPALARIYSDVPVGVCSECEGPVWGSDYLCYWCRDD